MKHKRLFEYQVTVFFLSNHHVTGDAQEIEYVCPFLCPCSYNQTLSGFYALKVKLEDMTPKPT